MARRFVVILVILTVCVLLVDSHGWWRRKKRRGRNCPSNDFENHICCDWKTNTWLVEWEECRRCRGRQSETGDTCQYYKRWGGIREGCVNKYAMNVTEVHCQLVCCEGWKPDQYGYCTIKDDGTDNSIVCENGGTPYGDSCACLDGFGGTRCEKPLCNPSCLHNGVCTGRDGKAVCACPEGKYTGPRCETPVCTPSCQNGGSCIVGAYEAWCLCPDGYEGTSCEKEVKDGECPPTSGFGTCADECTCDSECPNAQKCCRNGCGAQICREPAKHTCNFNGHEYPIGQRIRNDSCTTCFCKDPNSPKQWECTSVRCPSLSCSKVVNIAGMCCPICDNTPTTTTPAPTTERPSCVDQTTGVKYPVGHTVYHDNGCKPCTCESHIPGTSPTWQCMVIDCVPLEDGCRNIRRIQNQCCQVCDDPSKTTHLPTTPKPTCYDGETGIRHPVGSAVYFRRSCVPCTCVTNAAGNNATWDCPPPECEPLPPGCENRLMVPGQCCLICNDSTISTTQQPHPTCEYNGHRYPVGYNQIDNCSSCVCLDQGNNVYDWRCRHKDCPTLRCEHQIRHQGQCCPVCSAPTPTRSPTTPAPMCYYNGNPYPHLAERYGECGRCICQYQYGGYLDWACPVCPDTTTTTTKTTTVSPNTGPKFRNCPTEKVIIHTHRESLITVHETLKLIAHDAVGRTYTVTYTKTVIRAAPCSCSDNIHIITAQSTTDRYGRFATCIFTVHIVDNHPPVYNSCPSTISAFDDEIVVWDKPKVKDNVGIKSERFISEYQNNTKFVEGAHVLMYVAADYEGNVGVCRFLVSVYKRGTSDPTVPKELSRDNDDEKRKRIILPVLGVLAGLVLLTAIILLALCRRHLRRHNSEQRATTERHAYDNNIYAVPNTPPPSYRSSPIQGMKLPPKYIEDDKKPPVYDEVSVKVFSKKGGVDNPIYESSDDLDVGQIKVKLQIRDDADA